MKERELNFVNSLNNRVRKRYYCDDSGEINSIPLEENDQVYVINNNQLYQIESINEEEQLSGNITNFSGRNNTKIEDLKIGIEPVQAGSGDPSPDNVRPISGWSAVNVWRTGKNLYDLGKPTQTINGITFTRNADGSYTATGTATGSVSLQGQNVKIPAGTYMCSAITNGTASINASVYVNNSWKMQISTTAKSLSISEESDVRFVLYVANGQTANITFYPQIELGSTATPYEPYSGNQYTIQLGDTYYGGTLDVTSGVLTVDRVADTFTKDSVWYEFNTGPGNSSAVVQLSMYQNCKFVGGSASYNGSISSTGVEAPNYWTGARQNEVPLQGDMCFAYSSSGQLRFHRLDVASITDLESFKAAFPDTTICYYLATPITIPLTPTEITTLLGTNNLWANTGEIKTLDVSTKGKNIFALAPPKT